MKSTSEYSYRIYRVSTDGHRSLKGKLGSQRAANDRANKLATLSNENHVVVCVHPDGEEVVSHVADRRDPRWHDPWA